MNDGKWNTGKDQPRRVCWRKWNKPRSPSCWNKMAHTTGTAEEHRGRTLYKDVGKLKGSLRRWGSISRDNSEVGKWWGACPGTRQRQRWRIPPSKRFCLWSRQTLLWPGLKGTGGTISTLWPTHPPLATPTGEQGSPVNAAQGGQHPRH